MRSAQDAVEGGCPPPVHRIGSVAEPPGDLLAGESLGEGDEDVPEIRGIAVQLALGHAPADPLGDVLPDGRARRQFRVRRHAEMGDHAYCYPGFDLAEAPGDIVGPAPCVGADNDFVFRDLIGLTQAEYDAYRQQGVFD